jgi:CubicO group peptidase (beta-lactamase class C family)
MLLRQVFRGIRRVLLSILALYLLLFSFMRLIHYPEPIAAIRLGLAPAHATPKLMPAHYIPPTSAPKIWSKSSEQLPEKISFNGSEVTPSEFLTGTATNAFLVIRNGVITYEWYREDFDEKFLFPSYSVAKTLTSIMIGQLIDQGKIKESDTFVSFFPEFKNGTSFDDVTINQLLDMRSGVGVTDNYPSGPSGWGVAIAQMYATTDLYWFLGNNRKMKFEPGAEAEYRSVDTQMLGMIIKKVTGERVSDYFAEKIWQPLGATYGATWGVDRLDGQEKTFCCFNAAARDHALVGQLILDNGIANGSTIIPALWVNRLATPVVTLDRNWGYGAQIWHPFPGTSMLLGLHGQHVLVVPETKTVVVKLSDELNDDNEVPVTQVMYDIALRK